MGTMAVRMMARVALVLGMAAAAAHAQQRDADEKELAAYRLTKEGLDRYGAVLRALVAELKRDPRFQELGRVQAEIRTLEEKEDVTDAERARLEQLHARLEVLEEATDIGLTMSEEGSLSDMEAKLRATPPMAAALKAAGFPPREYVKFTIALFQASMAAGMQKAGLLKEVPEGLSPENLTFVQAHEADLLKLRREMEARAPGGR